MFELQRKADSQVLERFGALPPKFRIQSERMTVHSPQADWENDRYRLVEIPDETTLTREQLQDLINGERDRRLQTLPFAGKQYDFDSDSRQNILGAFALALAAIGNGAQPGDYRWADADKDFTWIAKDNSSSLMDAQTALAFGQAAASWKADHIRTARAIKDLDLIPSDYADDSRWPTA